MRLRLLLGGVALLVSVTCATAIAQPLSFAVPNVDDSAAVAAAMPGLAKAVLAISPTANERRALDNRFRLQVVAGEYGEALKTLATLRAAQWPGEPDQGLAYVAHRTFVEAKAKEAAGAPFNDAFAQTFKDGVLTLDDHSSAIVERAFVLSPAIAHDDLQQALARQRGKKTILVGAALSLVRAYETDEFLRRTVPLAAPLIADDDQRRYVVDTDLRVIMEGGATICAFVVRPRNAPARLPTLLQYTIYADRTAYIAEARSVASNGYAGVVGFTRGKACSPDKVIVPYEHDGADAAALIAWIAKQPWSDGRVGMFGGSYNSFVQWAAVKHLPPALKAIMPSVPNAPGIDTPMERNVFQSFSYPWPPYVTEGKWLDASTEGDPDHYFALIKRWYSSGKSYRAMDELDGVPNPIWDAWLDHPSYDAYWQRLIPYHGEFGRVNIPVLTTDGYLAGQDVGGLYYFTQYAKYRPDAENYLVIGPYDHIRGQRGTVSTLGSDVSFIAGYAVDPVAHIDIASLRYQWFDYIFKGGPKPAILQDRVNYEVMGADRWKHAPSIDAMHERMERFHLTTARSGPFYALAERRSAVSGSVAQSVNFADRRDVDRIPPATGLDTYLGVAYESPPLKRAFDLSGLFTGHLDFVTNKRDFDFNVSLYQKTPAGQYVGVTYYMARASYAGHSNRRQLLVPARRQTLDFVASRLTSWQFPAGSRLVVLISMIKEPDIQINYGTGGDVSMESIRDAKEPLQLKWFNDSYVEIPTSST